MKNISRGYCVYFLKDVAEFNKTQLIKRLVPVKRYNKVFMSHRYVNPNKGLINLQDVKRIDNLWNKTFKGKSIPNINTFSQNISTLTNTEIKAFVFYMMGDYKKINSQLRSKNVDATMQSLTKVLNNALVKFPILPKQFNESGNLIRFSKFQDNLNIGKNLKTEQLISATTVDKDIPFALSNIYKNSNTVYIIKPKNKTGARLIEPLRKSFGMNEGEVLFPLESRFKVLSVHKKQPYEIILQNSKKGYYEPVSNDNVNKMVDYYDLDDRDLKNVVYLQEI